MCLGLWGMHWRYVWMWMVVFAMTACKEKPVTLPEFEIPQGDRNVLIEEFTGVQCPNCPDGSAIIKQLKAELGDRLIPISIHHGFFARPLPESKQDLNCRCGYGDALIQTIGKGPLGYPAAVINRRKVGQKLYPNKDEWRALVFEELRRPAPAQMFLRVEGDSSSSSWPIHLRMAFAESIDDVKLFVVLVEDGIREVQILPDGTHDSDYIHYYVLRKPITPPEGLAIGSVAEGEIIERSFRVSVDRSWIAEHCSVIGFLYQPGLQNGVLQAVSAPLVH